MNASAKQAQIRQIIAQQGGKFFTAYFQGVKGDNHTLNGRTGVHRYQNGGKNNAEGKPHLITAFNVKKMGYRNLHLDGVREIRAGGKVYRFED